MNQVDDLKNDRRVVPTTSGMATASLALSLAGILFFPAAFLSIILGFVALKQIGISGGKIGGKAMAIAGIVISALLLVALIAIVLLFGTAIISGTMRSSQTARDVACGRNMLQIHKALLMAESESPAAGFPDDPRTLYPKYIDAKDVFKNARYGGSSTGNSKGYVYISGLSTENPQWILLHEDLVSASSGRHVVTTGGTLTFLTETEFQKRLEESNKSAREASRKPKAIPIDPSKF